MSNTDIPIPKEVANEIVHFVQSIYYPEVVIRTEANKIRLLLKSLHGAEQYTLTITHVEITSFSTSKTDKLFIIENRARPSGDKKKDAVSPNSERVIKYITNWINQNCPLPAHI